MSKNSDYQNLKHGQWKDSTEHQYLNTIKQVMKHAAKQNWVVQSEAVAVAKPRITDEKIPEAFIIRRPTDRA